MAAQTRLSFEKFKLVCWLSFRFVTSRSKALLEGPSVVSFFGLILGVACLVVSMAVMSGFFSTLQKSLGDVTGHIKIKRVGLEKAEWGALLEKLKKDNPEILAGLGYAYAEGVIAGKGKLNGVILQGVEAEGLSKVLDLRKRIIQGDAQLFAVGGTDPLPRVLIGKGISETFQLKAGDQAQIVFPLPSDYDNGQFKRTLSKVRVAGVLDLGKKEYDDRTIIIALDDLHKILKNDNTTGLILKLKDIDRARDVAFRIAHQLGSQFQISDWREINENLFDAIDIEKMAVFFVIFLIIVASSFNVSAALYSNVLKRYPDIGILKALGLSQKKIVQVFSMQGVLLGCSGFGLGLLVGILFCAFVSWAETRFGLIPVSVYRLDRIDLQIRAGDLVMIAVPTILICVIATLAPALRGARLSPVEGLRYES